MTPSKIRLNNPFGEITYMLMSNSDVIYSSKNQLFRDYFVFDENGNETTDTVRTYEYDRIYNFLKAQRAYTVSYETNGGTAAINSSNTDALLVS